MKNRLTFMLLFISVIACKAQSPIIDIEKMPYFTRTQENAYYKDINNFYNDFEGTWVATKGNKTLKIVLLKETKLYTGKFYTDYVSGEYEYKENGITIINTLSNTNSNLIGISASRLLKSHYKPPCNDCSPTKRRLRVLFSDNTRDIHNSLALQLITVNGKPALKGLLFDNGASSYHIDNPPAHFNMTIPTGWWTFIKQ
ncbi:hypothetical protein PG911_03540 [Tenacibaculum ovolyticum]|uniref:DUF6705 family protein n=1 Tax=Tenacibaculum ovolyticum TaxID=104270 RepID=UPI0022F3B39B|nr:DUF6705 family protein [Tenacibaculum ovolyticum]WBX77346.1 hypothetical protein PG911_03540 [Tenacibaculum ovolyticum]